MDAIFALARLVVAWLTGLTGSGQRDFFALIAGMKSWLHGREDTDGKSGVVVFVRRNLVVLLIALNVVVAILIGVGVSYIQKHSPRPVPIVPVAESGSPTPSTSATTQPPPPTPTPDPQPTPEFNLDPKINTDHWVSWAILDRQDGLFAGSENWNTPQYVLSSIKPWIAADYLNSHPDPDQGTLDAFTKMILDSSDQVAYNYWGGASSLTRLIQACGLTDVVRRDWSWSLTEFSARDAVRYLDCIYSGRATSAQWTAWIVNLMRHVRGEGDFGVRELFNPRTQIATKNGWYDWEGKWYVNCLAVGDDWAIAILQQFPAPGRWSGGDLKPGIEQADPICTSIAQQVLKLNV